ncbi:uncharacterized protein GIQ15_06063 [Arthroderma uncinatum]|uniref:uncharacterized protein n=1 Tax=Arthroderma uncinatum TaxID=74035 RepID=UPI00144A9F9D|nr:uncharacterized protein GIQ15_06063 [Arthroderma uncinatum]KAF3480716.1 hypothetical protein GIQ15_06063 [Arthroderma uncinatum]
MDVPRNISHSASQLFLLDKESSEYKAFLAIAHVPHPDRTILGSFINDAFDPEEAARYFLQITSREDSSTAPPREAVLQFLSDWKTLINKFRPTIATSLSNDTKKLIYERDGGQCCLTRAPFKSYFDQGLEYVHIITPGVFADPELSEGTTLFEMLNAFLSGKVLDVVRSSMLDLDPKQPVKLDNLWLLSTPASDAFKEGEVYLTVQTWKKQPDTSRKQTYSAKTNIYKPLHCPRLSMPTETIHIENRTPQSTPILNEELLAIHAGFSSPLAWIEVSKYMDVSVKDTSRGKPPTPSSASPFFSIFRRLWTLFPSFVRTSVYDILARIGLRLYGPSLSMTVFKLPFGLYLRRGSPLLAPKYHVEAHTLKLVEQSTRIPAPRAIDVVETPRFSYLLMTCVPGRPIGPQFSTMTDGEVEQAVVDLKEYVSELRKISRKPTEYQICNSQGGGILDWRIPDSQREELRFKSEAEFNKYLTDPFWEEIRIKAAKSHDIYHDIVFTHGDLNPRNILAENGRITGIVDWENAGWFPEYWEYTKAHYTVRGLKHWLVDVVDTVFPGYRDELVVENMLSDLLGPF